LDGSISSGFRQYSKSGGRLQINTTFGICQTVTPADSGTPAPSSNSTAGIVIGATIGVVALLAGVWYFFHRRKVSNNQTGPEMDADDKYVSLAS
jgi:hypothetical protein